MFCSRPSIFVLIFVFLKDPWLLYCHIPCVYTVFTVAPALHFFISPLSVFMGKNTGLTKCIHKQQVWCVARNRCGAQCVSGHLLLQLLQSSSLSNQLSLCIKTKILIFEDSVLLCFCYIQEYFQHILLYHCVIEYRQNYIATFYFSMN